MGEFFQLLAWAIVVGGGYFAWREYRRARHLSELRKAMPERTCIEVRLPRDTKDANLQMRKIYLKAQALVAADAESMRTGTKTIRMVYHAKLARGKQTPEMRFYVEADTDAMPRLKQIIKNEFNEAAYVVPIDESPTLHMVRQMMDAAETATEPTEPTEAAPAGA